MSDQDPFGEAMDQQEDQQADEDTRAADADDDVTEAFLDRMANQDRTKNETIGIAVNEEMKAVWSQLRQPADEGGIDTDVSQSVRNHIEKLAHRHNDATKRAAQKYEIDRK